MRGAEAGFVGVVGVVADRHFSVELVGAVVTVSRAGRPVVETTTNAEGRYELELEPGRYELRADYRYGAPERGACEVRAERAVDVTQGQALVADLSIDSSPCFE